MLSQTNDQNVTNSVSIESLIKHELADTISFHINKYGKTFERKLGLTRDDLMNDIREQVWKGLLTHTKTGGANLKTYMNTLIKNRFGVLYRRSLIKKYNSVDYFADVFSAGVMDSEFLETEETGETVFERRQELMRDLVVLDNIELKIYSDLILGFKLNEMTDRNKLSLAEVIGAINRIDERLKSRRGNSNE